MVLFFKRDENERCILVEEPISFLKRARSTNRGYAELHEVKWKIEIRSNEVPWTKAPRSETNFP
jgi:hypothetical protein